MPRSRRRPPPPPPRPAPDEAVLPEDVATLQEQLRLCRAQNTYLHRELATALTLAPIAPTDGTPPDQVQLALDQLRERFGMLKLHYAQAQQEIAHLRHVVHLLDTTGGWKASTLDALWDEAGQEIDQCLRRLLTLAHPDRWSHGQLAAELAHEVASAINKQRASLAKERTP